MYKVTLKLREREGRFYARIDGGLREFPQDTAVYFVNSDNFNDALHSFDTHGVISAAIQLSPPPECGLGIFIPLGRGGS